MNQSINHMDMYGVLSYAMVCFAMRWTMRCERTPPMSPSHRTNIQDILNTYGVIYEMRMSGGVDVMECIYMLDVCVCDRLIVLEHDTRCM